MATKATRDYGLIAAAERAGLDKAKTESITWWLKEQFIAHQYAKLSQGGHIEHQVPLRQVFIDLPIADTLSIAAERQPRSCFLEQVLASSPLSLKRAWVSASDATTLKAQIQDASTAPETANPRRRRRDPEFGATLLVGGPGQGKSTLGQLACQLHRVGLLLPLKDALSSTDAELICQFETAPPTTTSGTALEVPKSPSLPLQVVLPDFAEWLANAEGNSKNIIPDLLLFLADQPSAKASNVEASTLFALACHMPCFLFLDGFDEVGATQDRNNIVAAASAFFEALSQRNALVQVVATTRPQGYAGELAQMGVRLKQRYLTPLVMPEALEYAKKLVGAKISGVDERKKTLNRLMEAAKEPATQRLLTTPLQVTSSYRSHAKAPSLRSERIASAAVMTRCKPSQIVFAP
ncbi:NACHT domain-containing protein, partial [Paraburkholderia aspalathi]|uniref:hypothetical protein n=1 Tax=Paraburkholderia aspalathi TaxID=1324617 RepID=UPI00190D90C0